MPIIFTIFITLVLCLTLYITNIFISKPNKNILLNTTLPFSELNNEEVIKILNDFKKGNTIFLILTFTLNIPAFLIASEFIYFIWLLSWIFAIMSIHYFFLKKYITRLRKLKMEKDWFISDKHIISVDTEVSRIKDKMPISIFWFIPSFAISIGIIIYTILEKDDLYEYKMILACTSIFTSIIFLIIYKILSAERTKVYSEDSNINLACNLIYRRTWSIVFVLLSTIQSVFTLFACFMYSQIEIITAIIIIMVIMSIVPVFIGYIKIRDNQNKILMAAENIIYTDDDEYWGILFYNNPNDSNLMVEKRIGIGQTLNFANPTAKIITSIFFIILLLTLVPVGFLMVKTSNAKFNLLLDNDKISIDAPIYGIDFNKNDIQEVSLISSLPKGLKTNGTGTNYMSLGNYKFDGYGPSKVFVHKDLDKIIVIKLTAKYVFFTGNNNEETDKYYNELLSCLNEK